MLPSLLTWVTCEYLNLDKRALLFEMRSPKLLGRPCAAKRALVTTTLSLSKIIFPKHRFKANCRPIPAAMASASGVDNVAGIEKVAPASTAPAWSLMTTPTPASKFSRRAASTFNLCTPYGGAIQEVELWLPGNGCVFIGNGGDCWVARCSAQRAWASRTVVSGEETPNKIEGTRRSSEFLERFPKG
ncbi:hypothetical protein PIB30_016193 [Stylosanthes scabra]|uniref:Uncharacterized protein n=1 Tax=Stylosanthes scabra TaxID=79078 RepID=A0ABU6V9J1_9FABA|nr:hypothetical protein [Stylosanthes scabra]